MTATVTNNFQINWIGRLLQRGTEDRKKEVLRLILGPYLIKRKSYDEAATILQDWLDKCNSLRSLDVGFNTRQRIKAALKNTRGFLKLKSLKIKYPWLYESIINC